jgi:hypothetical protein
MPNDKSLPEPETAAKQETGGDCVSRLVLGLCECGCGKVLGRRAKRFARGHHSRVENYEEANQKRAKTLKDGFAAGRIKHRGALPVEVHARIGAENSARSKGKINHPTMGRGEINRMAKWWNLRSPDNRTFRFKNVSEFVRGNPALFDEDDIQWDAGKLGCRATAGLASLSPRKKNPKGSWKGWTWVSITERITNDGEDLLGRISSENADVDARRDKTPNPFDG